MNKKSVPILVVEDSGEDFEVLERAFKKVGFDVPLYHCKSGEEAINLLYRQDEYEFFPKDSDPSMILLDLNMPGMGGHAMLENVKDDDRLKHIPVIVLSTSGALDDVNKSYKHGANSYMRKPEDMSGYTDMVKALQDYWYMRCCIPAQDSHA